MKKLIVLSIVATSLTACTELRLANSTAKSAANKVFGVIDTSINVAEAAATNAVNSAGNVAK